MSKFEGAPVVVPPFRDGRRRRFSDAEKRSLILKAFAENETLSLVARRHDIAVGLLFRWQKALGLVRPAATDEPKPMPQSMVAVENRLRDLEEQVSAIFRALKGIEHKMVQGSMSTEDDSLVAFEPADAFVRLSRSE
ncbi:MAG: transposase [Deltaproteobacteria bacterium]|nr:transposase [Deltaproteobacteria bacterium]